MRDLSFAQLSHSLFGIFCFLYTRRIPESVQSNKYTRRIIEFATYYQAQPKPQLSWTEISLFPSNFPTNHPTTHHNPESLSQAN